MNRRKLLISAAFAMPLGFALADCTATTPVTTTQLASDTNLLAAAVSAVLTSAETLPNVSAAAIAQIQTYLQIVQNDAATVAAETAVVPPTLVEQISQAVQSVASILLPLAPSGSQILTILNAALALLPAVLSAVGIAAIPSKHAPKMSPEHARLVLAAATQ